MLIDTVGFIRRLPHHLVQAFHSTLEQAVQADIILNVCDASSPEAQTHLKVTQEILTQLGCRNRPVISVLNQCDKVPELSEIPMIGNAVRISAKTGAGLDSLLKAIEQNLPVNVRKVSLLLPFEKAGLAAKIRKEATLLSESYVENGLCISAIVGEELYNLLKEYEVKDSPEKP